MKAIRLLSLVILLGTSNTAVVRTADAQTITDRIGWNEFLRGHWVTECKRIGIARYAQTGYTFSDFAGAEFPIVIQNSAWYVDDKCQTQLQFGQNLGTLVLRAGALGPIVKGVKVRWQIQPLIRYLYAFYTKGKVDELNQKKYCGFDNWQVGKAKDLLKSECAKEIEEYYQANWFGLEVMGMDQIKLSDRTGASDVLTRSKLTVSKPVQ
jgi:hypothetical protein